MQENEIETEIENESAREKATERDRDKDGVLDKDDKCPKIPGLLSLEGCPDCCF